MNIPLSDWIIQNGTADKKLNPEKKKLWLEALRSGNYKQCTLQLKNGANFCCLGVASDLYLKANDLKWDDGIVNSVQSILTTEIAGWFDCEISPSIHFSEEVELHGDLIYRTVSLYELNDDHNMSFGEIAAIIEALF